MDTYRTPPITSIAIALTLLLLGAAPALHAAVVPCEVAVDFGSSLPLAWGADAHAAFRREATRVWTREGVRFCWAGDPSCASAPVLYVRVVTEVPGTGADGRPALGWIGFSDRTGPGPLILLSLRWARELIGRAERGARALAELPGMITRLLPQALGRALAHELGHYLLARREHAPSGVMRAAFRPEDLADQAVGGRLGLQPQDRQQLRARCSEPGTWKTTLLVARNP
jgi:hypothetical protein